MSLSQQYSKIIGTGGSKTGGTGACEGFGRETLQNTVGVSLTRPDDILEKKTVHSS